MALASHPPTSAKVKERVELHLYYPFVAYSRVNFTCAFLYSVHYSCRYVGTSKSFRTFLSVGYW